MSFEKFINIPGAPMNIVNTGSRKTLIQIAMEKPVAASADISDSQSSKSSHPSQTNITPSPSDLRLPDVHDNGVFY